MFYTYSSGVHTHNMLFAYCLKIKYGRHGRHFDFIPNICDDYSSRTINGRDMGFSPKGNDPEEPAVPVVVTPVV